MTRRVTVPRDLIDERDAQLFDEIQPRLTQIQQDLGLTDTGGRPSLEVWNEIRPKLLDAVACSLMIGLTAPEDTPIYNQGILVRTTLAELIVLMDLWADGIQEDQDDA